MGPSSRHGCHQFDQGLVSQQAPRDSGIQRAFNITSAVVGVSFDVAFPTYTCLNLVNLYLGCAQAGQRVQRAGGNVDTVTFENDHDLGIEDRRESSFDSSPALASAPMALETEHFPWKDGDDLLDLLL